MMKRILLLSLLLFSLTEVFAGLWILVKVERSVCPIKYIGEHKTVSGVIIAPVGFTVTKSSNCEITYTYHLEDNTRYKTVSEIFYPHIYISGTKIEISDNYTLEEDYKGNITHILNALQNSVFDFNTTLHTTIPWIDESHFPSIDEATREINYGTLINDLFNEVTVQGVKNYVEALDGAKIGNFIVNIEFINESTAMSYLFYNITIIGNATLDPYIHKGKIIFYGVNNSTPFSKEVILNNNPIKISFIPIGATYNITVENGKESFSIVSDNISVHFIKEIHWQDIFGYLDMWGLIESKITRKVSSSGAVICDKCKSYVFEDPGKYYLSYDGNPSIDNKPVIIVKPDVKGVVHTTIYPENKVEERNLFTLTAAGVGDHLIKIKIGNTYERKFVIPEGSELKGNVILDFNNNKLKIKYFLNNEFKGVDEVMSIDFCLHKDCSIPYEIWYDDAYGFKKYKLTLFAKSNINIRWNNLTITLEKTTLKDKNPSTLKINVINKGPVKASEIKVRNLKYNSRCIEVTDLGDIINLESGQSGVLTLSIKIKDYHCSEEDYKISFDVYGWNTYIYSFSIYVPVSYIESPKEDSLILRETSLTIKDKNAKSCKIIINNTEVNRDCNKMFLPYDICEDNDQPDCYINVVAENDHFRFISEDYKFRVAAYLELTHNKTVAYDGKPFLYSIIIRNLGDVIAKDITLKDIKYNSDCLFIKPITNKIEEIYVLNEAPYTFEMRILSAMCDPEDYMVNFSFQGYNTLLYSYSIIIPTGNITFPPQFSILPDKVIFSITDKNANICTISFGNETMERKCDISFVYDNYCKEPGVCIVNITSENDFLKYIDTYYYMIPHEVSGSLYAVVSPKTLYFTLGSERELLVTISNGKEESVICEYSIDTNLLAVKKVELNGDTLIGHKFTIPGKNSVNIVYTLVSLKGGLENLKISVSCDSGDSLTIKVPVIVGQETNIQLSGENVVYNDDKFSWILLAPMAIILLLLA